MIIIEIIKNWSWEQWAYELGSQMVCNRRDTYDGHGCIINLCLYYTYTNGIFQILPIYVFKILCSYSTAIFFILWNMLDVNSASETSFCELFLYTPQKEKFNIVDLHQFKEAFEEIKCFVICTLSSESQTYYVCIIHIFKALNFRSSLRHSFLFL